MRNHGLESVASKRTNNVQYIAESTTDNKYPEEDTDE